MTESSGDLAQLARRHCQFLATYAYALCGDAADAQDLVQQTFERLLSTPASRLPQRDERAWLVTVLRNLFVDQHRRRARSLQRVDVDLTLLPADDDEPPPVWGEVTPSQVRAALATLRQPFATAFALHALEGRPYAEIADALGTSVSTVGTRILRARRQLRTLLAATATAEGGDGPG